MQRYAYDVIIIGGGLVGSATAREILTRNPLVRLALVEKEQSVGELILFKHFFNVLSTLKTYYLLCIVHSCYYSFRNNYLLLHLFMFIPVKCIILRKIYYVLVSLGLFLVF